MRRRQSEILVFSTSALDLFAAALGAFILIVLILFPYYQRGGADTSMAELEELVEQRREARAAQETELSEVRVIQAEIELLEAQYRAEQANLSEIEDRLQEALRQTADIEIPDPPPVPEPKPEPVPEPPRNLSRGIEFSILGLATSKKDIVILVDMSGSMTAHSEKVVGAILEVLAQMKSDNQFAIIGYRGGPTFDSFPSNGRLVSASTSNLQAARQFVNDLPRRFGGGTPTQIALVQALNLSPGAVILMSDGAPDDGRPASIITNITARNRNRAEIHTVALGDYTGDPGLTQFLQELARRNQGDFVGRAR